MCVSLKSDGNTMNSEDKLEFFVLERGILSNGHREIYFFILNQIRLLYGLVLDSGE